MHGDDFDALVTLIERLIAIRSETSEHPNDHSRQRRLVEDREYVIDEARRALVDPAKGL
jgi:hypothetical protein